jgi:hypothetical protein
MINKRGQFYLVAAVIIILAISGIATVKTYAIAKPESKKINDLSYELNQEGSRVIDYGIYNSNNANEKIETFLVNEYGPYFLKKTENTNVVFIYGDKNTVYTIQYVPEKTGTISAVIGGGTTELSLIKNIANVTAINVNNADAITVMILGKEYNFDIKQNEMFYFIITQEVDEETYVEKN